MGKHKPRAGSLAFYPRVRASKETPSFSTFQKNSGVEAKPLNFLGFKAGMLHASARDTHARSVTSGMEISVPCTVIECPPLKVFGIRGYCKETGKGKQVAIDVFAEKFDKHLARKLKSTARKKKTVEKKEKGLKEGMREGKEKQARSVANLESKVGELSEIKLLVHSQPALTGIGRKKPDVFEIALSGSIEKQLEFAKSKLGGELKASEVFKEKQFADVRAVSKGKGIQGPVKRFGIKDTHRKAKKHRTVGSISPWHPATVMWTVARAGQMGYHNRTEFNKRVLLVSSNPERINPKSGFKHFGIAKNEFLLVAGSIPGPSKRAIALRNAIRKTPEHKWEVSEVSIVKGEKT